MAGATAIVPISFMAGETKDGINGIGDAVTVKDGQENDAFVQKDGGEGVVKIVNIRLNFDVKKS